MSFQFCIVTLFDDTITWYVKSCQGFVQRAVAVTVVLFRQSLELLLKLFYVYFRPVTCSWTLLCAAGGQLLLLNKMLVQWKDVAYIKWGENLSCQCCTQICLPCVKW